MRLNATLFVEESTLRIADKLGDFQFLKIDTSVMVDGSNVMKEYCKEPQGISWFTILDGDGKELIDSTGPDENVGYPVAESEIAWFMKMIKQTSKDPSEEGLASVKKSLENYTAKWRR